MKSDRNLGNAFLDVIVAGAIATTIGVVVNLVRGNGVDLPLLGLTLLCYCAYLIGAVRTGASPIDYLRRVGRRGS